MLEKGETITSQTRGFNAVKGSTESMRGKEGVNDYRYFPEPDLLPYIVTPEKTESILSEMPTLPNTLLKRYTEEYGLSEYDALNISESRELSDYYNAIISKTTNYKSAANWLMGEVKSHLNKFGVHISDFKITPSQIAEIISLLDSAQLSHSAASQKLFPALEEHPESSPTALATKLDLIQNSNENELETVVEKVLETFPDETARIRSGEMKLIGFFMGQIMKASNGKADPKKTNQILMKKIKS